jgi:hypothetical protein
VIAPWATPHSPTALPRRFVTGVNGRLMLLSRRPILAHPALIGASITALFLANVVFASTAPPCPRVLRPVPLPEPQSAASSRETVTVTDFPPFHAIHNSSDPWFASNGVVPSLSFTRAVYHRSDDLTEIYVDLPPFYWALPLGFDAQSARLFWAQEENYRHFNDSNIVRRGKVQVFKNHRIVGQFSPVVNLTHYVNYHHAIVQPCENPDVDILYFMMSHDTYYFQHFLDNGMPHISLMELATGFDPANVTFVGEDPLQPCIPYLLSRYGFKESTTLHSTFDRAVCAKNVVLPEVVPVVHPILTQHFIDGLKLDHKIQELVILVSRTFGEDSKPERIITNQDALEGELRKLYGENFTVFRSGMSTAEAIEVFQRARLVIGSHGGAMYNALWASRECKVVEILPLREDGGYPDQGPPDGRLTFAHLAFHTNAMMNFQRYYRYYEWANDMNYNLDLPRFIPWLQDVFPEGDLLRQL